MNKIDVGNYVILLSDARRKSVIGNSAIEYEYDGTRCKFGRVVSIRKTKQRGHSPRIYNIQLFSPNFGIIPILGIAGKMRLATSEEINEHIEDKDDNK